MAFSSDTKLLITFDDPSPLDQINGVLNTFGAYKTVTGKIGNALKMSLDTYYDISALNTLSTGFTIGFWLQSTNPGIATNPSGSTIPLKIALLSKSNSNYASNITTLNSEMFSVWEETQTNGTNKMKVRIVGATTATLTTSSYSVGTFHHFWIVYNGSFLRVYIDGALDASTVSGTIPASLTSSIANFSINHTIDGHSYETVRNQGLLDDLVIFSTAHTSKTDIFRAIDLSVSYVADTNLQLEDEVSFGTVFDDTSTIQINSIFGNRGNVYIGRTDGVLLKGSRTLWESRRDFSTPEEARYLSVITRSISNNYVIQDGALTITNAIIRV